MSNVINTVAVTIASLNKPGAYFANDNVTMSHSGLVISGWKIEIGHAVFCGRVLETKEIAKDGKEALGICLDDGTGIHVFNDNIRNIAVTKGEYVKIFGVLKPNKDDATKTSVIVHVIRKVDRNPGSVMSLHMLEAIRAVGLRMGNESEVPEIQHVPEDDSWIIKREGLDLETCKVLSIVLNNKSDAGAVFPDEFAKVEMEPEEIMKTLNELADNGHIYSTIDDIHFKST